MESSADRDESPFNSQTLIRGMAVEVMSNRSISKDPGFSKNRGKTPKMDGENNGKPY